MIKWIKNLFRSKTTERLEYLTFSLQRISKEIEEQNQLELKWRDLLIRHSNIEIKYCYDWDNNREELEKKGFKLDSFINESQIWVKNK